MSRVQARCQWPGGCTARRTTFPGWGCKTHWKRLPTVLLLRLLESHDSLASHKPDFARAVSDANLWAYNRRAIHRIPGRRSKARHWRFEAKSMRGGR